MRWLRNTLKGDYMDKHRIYQDKIEIDDSKVKGFYNRQASMAENPLGAAFLGQQDRAVLEEKIFTQKQISSQSCKSIAAHAY